MIEEQKHLFEMDPQISNSMDEEIPNLNSRISERIRKSYRLSQGNPNRAYTEDDYGDEGITEMMNYLSDSDTEQPKERTSANFRLPSQSISISDDHRNNKNWTNKLNCSTPPSNETGTFPFDRGSDIATFARESKEQSMRKTHEDEDTSDINKEHYFDMNYANPEINRDSINRVAEEEMMFINKRNPREYSRDEDSIDDAHKGSSYNPYYNFQFKDTQAETLINKFESRIKKTDPDSTGIREEIKETIDQDFEDTEEEEEEEEPEFTKEQMEFYPKRSTYRARQHEEKFNRIDEQFERLKNENYIESASDQYNTNDYENAISNTYAKAKKYKRKAKKLYNNLQKLKIHYDKAK